MFDFLPTFDELMEVILPWIEWSFLVFPIISLYVTYVHFKWWRIYNPSPLIRHLLISSAAVDLSALTIALLAADALDLIPFDLPPGAGTLLLAIALAVAMGVKVYRRINLRALDNPDVEQDLTQRVETQDQREDRQFGEERRSLEVEHASEASDIADAAIDAGYAEGVLAGRKEETGKQAEDRRFGDKRRDLEDNHIAD